MALTVTSRITINSQALRQINQNALRALVMTADALHTEIANAEVIPFKDGGLSGEFFYVDDSRLPQGEVALVNHTPYARRLYYHPEYNFHRTVWTDSKGTHGAHRFAGAKWFRFWSPGGTRETFVPETFAEIYRRLMGK